MDEQNLTQDLKTAKKNPKEWRLEPFIKNNCVYWQLRQRHGRKGFYVGSEEKVKELYPDLLARYKGRYKPRWH